MYLNDYKKSKDYVIYHPTSKIVLDKIGNQWMYMESGTEYGISTGTYIPTAFYIPSKEDLESNAWTLLPKLLS